MATYCLRFSAQSLTSWYLSDTTSHHDSFCLARHQCRCTSVDKCLYPMSALKDSVAQCDSLPSFPLPDCRFDVVLIWLDPYHCLTNKNLHGQIYTLASAISSITAEAVAQALTAGWISRFGILSTIITDHGQQFESNLWSTLMTLLGSKCTHATAYHP